MTADALPVLAVTSTAESAASCGDTLYQTAVSLMTQIPTLEAVRITVLLLVAAPATLLDVLP